MDNRDLSRGSLFENQVLKYAYLSSFFCCKITRKLIKNKEFSRLRNRGIFATNGIFWRGWPIRKMAIQNEISSNRIVPESLFSAETRYFPCFLGFFNIDQSRQILSKAQSIGLKLNFHAETISNGSSAEVSQHSFIFKRWILSTIYL